MSPTQPLRVLAMEPYYGGSHQAFLDGWSRRSRHVWTMLTLPANKWKWRMRQAAITFAEGVAERVAGGESWDVVFCSDMLNLAEFRGLVHRDVTALPCVAYFHENQLTYPVQVEKERDFHFVVTNLTTCLAASRVWFNSAYHRDTFIDALPRYLKRMPGFSSGGSVDAVAATSSVRSPGIERPSVRGNRHPGPLRVLWAARWEHDKSPEQFFEALRLLKERGVAFRLSVIGEWFQDAPSVFERARDYFADEIEHWGYQSSREDYLAVLAEADVLVSTANHEFFGIGVVEAIGAGVRPLLPDRLSYPEILSGVDEEIRASCLYDGTTDDLVNRLAGLAESVHLGEPREDGGLAGSMARYSWGELAGRYDSEMDRIVEDNRTAEVRHRQQRSF